MMNKVIKDGKVAVLVSAGYGAGWYSWSRELKECLFDPEIVSIVMANSEDDEIDKRGVELVQNAARKWDGFYSGRASGLYIEWVDEGSIFEISVYDGHESIHIIGDRDYITA